MPTVLNTLTKNLTSNVLSYILVLSNFQSYATISSKFFEAVMSSEAWSGYFRELDLQNIVIPKIFYESLPIAWHKIKTIHSNVNTVMPLKKFPGCVYYHWAWSRTSTVMKPKLGDKKNGLFQASTPVLGSCTVHLYPTGYIPTLQIGFTNSPLSEAVLSYYPVAKITDAAITNPSTNRMSCLTINIVDPSSNDRNVGGPLMWHRDRVNVAIHANLAAGYMNGVSIAPKNAFHWPETGMGSRDGDTIVALEFGVTDSGMFSFYVNNKHCGQLDLMMYQEFVTGPKYPFIYVDWRYQTYDQLDIRPQAMIIDSALYHVKVQKEFTNEKLHQYFLKRITEGDDVVPITRRDMDTLLHTCFVGVIVQDLRSLFRAASLHVPDLNSITRDTCYKHWPRHEWWCHYCQQERWDSHERCRNLVTNAFAALLHHSLRQAYITEEFPAIQFPYPDEMKKFTLQQLRDDKDKCEEFLQSLWAVNGNQNGSVFFYQYGCFKKRFTKTPMQYIQGLSWQLVLPYGIAGALIANPHSISQRPGVLKIKFSCR